MATNVSELASGARTYLRDYPQYFEVDEGPLNVLTIRLPHPLIQSSSLQVYTTDSTPTTTLTTDWQLDARNGLLKLTDEALLNQRVLVAGYHYSWFSDEDLNFHVTKVVHEMDYSNDVSTFGDAEMDVIILGGVVRALWSLAVELSLDIDVSTPEGIYIPARQRFAQVMQMLTYWEAEYNTKSSMLNIGLGSIEQFRLRRVAYLTNRLVPVYQEQEVDDRTRPDRLYPPIPEGIPPSNTPKRDAIEQFIKGEEVSVEVSNVYPSVGSGFLWGS